MTTAASTSTLAPSILLVEPGISGYSQRALQLEASNYRVERAEGVRDMFLMRRRSTFALAVLSVLSGSFVLRAAAQMAWKEWPKARILILGTAPAHFEDNLYDAAIAQTTEAPALLAKVHLLTEEYWDRRGDTLIGFISGLRAASPRAMPSLIEESDPTKTPPTLFLTGDTRNWADSGRRFHGSRLARANEGGSKS